MRTTAIAVFILTTALSFGFLIALEDLPARVTQLLFAVSDDPVVVLLMLNLLLLIIGAFMDTISAMVILATVLIAIGQQLGLDPVHLGAIVVINLAIGFPPRPSASTCSSAPPSPGCGSRRSPGRSGRCCWSRFWCCWR